ncbi:MAG TPA: sulfurtransferase [Solirubrobacteraceae bacterium]|nr:sulfurtransferase [Solirubrobacteraceae bacterium]
MTFGPLITGNELAHLDPPPIILDVRWEIATGADRSAYLEAHVPGAQFVDLDRQLSDPPSERGRHPLPDGERFGVEMRSLGVSGARPVVVYDAAASMAAARAWWVLRYFGHPQVAVLDGGLAGWVAAGQPVTHEVSDPAPGDFVAQPGAMPVLDASQAGELARRGVLLDARARERFAGELEPIDPVAGHIPGARNRPTAENVDAAGRFKAPSVLRAAFESSGVRDDVPVGAYCGSGVTAAHAVLALERAGYEAALYPGSWSEWVADPSRPVATGMPETAPGPVD